MDKKLIIVESPVKAKKIQAMLGEGYTVRATAGHFVDLPAKGLGVDLETMTEEYVPIVRRDGSTSEQTIKMLKSLSSSHEHIYLATDPDREGEAIAEHLRRFLHLKQGRFSKIDIHVITPEGVQRALSNPRRLNEQLLLAQSARRVLDRLVGYGLSPVVSAQIPKAKSVGRLQLAGLRLICDREEEIESFVSKKLYAVSAEFSVDGQGYKCYLTEKNWERYASGLPLDVEAGGNSETDGESGHADGKEFKKLVSESSLSHVANELSQKLYSVSRVTKKETSVPQPKPMITSDMQKTAAARFGWEADKTMSVAQELFRNGYITYHRTDSVRIDEAASREASTFVEKQWGSSYRREDEPGQKVSKNAQDAHESIRPSYIEKEEIPEGEYSPAMREDMQKLYDLIRRRFLQVHMKAGRNAGTRFEIESDDGAALFAGGYTVPVFDGWRVLEVKPERGKTETAGPAKGGMAIVREMQEESWNTQPPARYDAGSLVAVLEKKEIGRPSTYATVSAVLQKRMYIQTDEKKRYFPTEIGKSVREWFRNGEAARYIELGYTADMEKNLDGLSTGQDRFLFLKKTADHLKSSFNAFNQGAGMSTPATERQVNTLNGIKTRGGDVPEEAYESFAAAREFITKYYAQMKPSEEQVKFAKQLSSRHKNAILTEEILNSVPKIREFIDKWKNCKPDIDNGEPPSEGQIKYAQSLAEQLGCGVDATRMKTKMEAAKYIDEMVRLTDGPPSDRALQYAEKIAETLNVEYSKETRSSKAKTSEFIDKHKERYEKKQKKK